MGMLTRGLIGGLAGGAMTGDWAGIGAGAAGGVLGGKGFKNFAKLGSIGGGVSGIGRSGLGMMSRGLKSGSASLRRMSGGQSGYRGMAASRGAGVLNSMRGAVANTRRFVDRTSSVTNKYGGYAMGAIGTASAAYIGSSVMKSNRGYR